MVISHAKHPHNRIATCRSHTLLIGSLSSSYSRITKPQEIIPRAFMPMALGSSTTPTDTMGSNKSRGISRAAAVTHRLGTCSSFSATVNSWNGGLRVTVVADVILSAGTNLRTRTPTPAHQTVTNVDHDWSVRGKCSGPRPNKSLDQSHGKRLSHQA